MKIEEKEIVLKNGRTILLRSPGGEDAPAQQELRRITSGQTHFMARYPEEVEFREEAARQRLEAVAEDSMDFFLSAFEDGKMAADAGVQKIRSHLKYRHRCSFGISIRREYWGQGLGSRMLAEAVGTARENGFEQMELGVFSDNARAIHMYEKAGFRRVGIQPRAFKLKDGSYRDELLMVLFL